MDKAIELISVSKEYSSTLALDEVTLSVNKNSLHGFLGPNGAGKSTAMKIITGVTKATTGELYLNGEKIVSTNRNKYSIGYLPENPPLYNNMLVKEYLQFVGQIWKIKKEKLNSAVNNMLETCSLTTVSKRLIGNLSKGYRQRVGLAQALIHNPEIIILDEPMSGLDPQAISEIRTLIKELSTDHTIILSTHQLHEIDLICDYISIINRGKIVKSGKLNDIQNHLKIGQTITTELLNWNNNIESLVKSNFEISDINVTQGSDLTKVTFRLPMDKDVRADLSSLLTKEKCVILDFKQEKSSLEDIFHNYVDNKTGEHNDFAQ